MRSQPTRLLPGRQLIDPTLVTLLTGELGGEEHLDHLPGLLVGLHASPEAQYIGVVVLAGQPGDFGVVGQRGTNSRDLVRGDLLTIARPAEYQPK